MNKTAIQNADGQKPDPETWKKILKAAIAILTALLGLLGAGAAGAKIL